MYSKLTSFIPLSGAKPEPMLPSRLFRDLLDLQSKMASPEGEKRVEAFLAEEAIRRGFRSFYDAAVRFEVEDDD